MPHFLTSGSGSSQAKPRSPTSPAEPDIAPNPASEVARLLKQVKGAGNRALVAKAMAMIDRGQMAFPISNADPAPEGRT